MAGLVLGAIGGFFFGPIGWVVGSLIGNLLFPQKQEGPKLTDLKLHNSSYGQMIPILYGTMRVAGNVIWQTDLHEHEHKQGGKGGPEVTTFTYSASFAILLCEGVATSISKVWADSTLIWNVDGTVGDVVPCTFYPGNESQVADPTMEAELGVGNVPAYRGSCYVVFDEPDLSPYGNRIPVYNFEVNMVGLPTVPIHIIAENDNEPEHWRYRDTGGTEHYFFAAIRSWPGTPGASGDIRIRGVNDSNVQTYDTNLNWLATDTLNSPADDWPVGYATPMTYNPVGMFKFQGGLIKVWADGSGVRTTGISNDQPVIAAGSLSINDPSGHGIWIATTGINLPHLAGIPNGLHVAGVALTQDGSALFLFTTTAGVVSNWWMIVEDQLADSGTVSPTLGFGLGSGTSCWSGSSGGSGAHSMSVENNRVYFWHYAPPNVTLYSIKAGVFAVDSDGGSISVPNPNGVGLEYPSTLAFKEGYCGIANGVVLAVLSRFPLDSGPGVPLSDIVSNVSTRCGLDVSEIDVTALTDIVDGYAIQQQQAGRDDVTPLQSAYFFDAVESSGVVTFVKRGGASVVTIPDSELAARPDGAEAPALVTPTRGQEVDLPAMLTVKYVNASNDYQTGSQFSQRQVTQSQQATTIELAISMSDAKGKQISKALLLDAWVSRTRYTLSTSRKYDYLEPTDVIDAHGYQLRITGKRNIANNIVELDGVAALSAIWTSGPSAVAVSGLGFTPSVTSTNQPSEFVPLDIPLVTDTDDQHSLYVPMAGSSVGTWRGATLYKSVDAGVTYAQVASVGTASVMGTAASVLGDFRGGNIFDEGNSGTIVIGPGGGTLESATELAVLNGANKAVWGNEVLQFKNAPLIAPSTYLVSGFLRGRRGTEWAIPNHGVGERFVLLTPTQAPISDSELGQTRLYKPVSFGGSLSGSTAVPFVDYGSILKPYAPVHLGGGSDASGNVTINWQRRTRVGGAWSDGADVPLSEATEAYVLQIWDNHFQHVARVVSVTAPTFVYTSAMQVSDFGSQQQTIFVSVGQVGAYMLGTQASAEVPGAGGSNSSIIAPVPPYNNPPPQTGVGCSGTVVNTTMSWATPVRVSSGDDAGGPGWTWVIKFTTGSIASGAGRIQAFAGSGDQLPMGGTFTTEPCGFPLAPTQVRLPISSLVQFRFYLTGNPSPGSIPTLLPSTDYYLCITRPAVGAAMSCDLFSIL